MPLVYLASFCLIQKVITTNSAPLSRPFSFAATTSVLTIVVEAKKVVIVLKGNLQVESIVNLLQEDNNISFASIFPSFSIHLHHFYSRVLVLNQYGTMRQVLVICLIQMKSAKKITRQPTYILPFQMLKKPIPMLQKPIVAMHSQSKSTMDMFLPMQLVEILELGQLLAFELNGRSACFGTTYASILTSFMRSGASTSYFKREPTAFTR